MQFNEVIGRETEKSYLRDMVHKNRLAHSLLFLSNEGSGALQMAIAFAQYILCERVNPKEPVAAGPSLFGDEPAETSRVAVARPDSCGACPACIKAQQNVHPDLHFSYPVLKRDSKHDRVLSVDYISEWRLFLKEHPYGNITDWLHFLVESPTARVERGATKQGNISVHECDDIIQKLSLRPFESEFKILIMWMPEFLGKEGNRLLKLIEEPPAGTIFIFVAEDDNEILQTILSRTQLVKIPSPTDEEVEKYLLNRNVDAVQASQAAAVAAGNVREALKSLHGTDDNWQQIIRSWLNVIYQNKIESQAKWIDETSSAGREKLKQLFSYFLHLIELSVRVRFMNADEVRVLDESERDFAHTLNKMCGVEALEEMAKELEKAIYYVERNANAKLLLHALTIRFFHLIKQKQLILIH